MTKTTRHTIFKLAFSGLLLIISGCGIALPSKISVHSPRLYFATTDDGWRLALHRYRPRARDKSRNSILLVSSPNYNAAFWSAHDDAHFARYLAKRGWDVWALSLRGTGRSTRPGYTTLDALSEEKPPAPTAPTRFELKAFDWTLDDYIFRDLPAALKFVRQHVGGNKVTLIGHGLGGGIVLAHLSQDREYAADRAVAVAPVFKWFPPVPDVFSQAFAENGRSFSSPHTLAEILYFNRDNMDPEVEGACVSYAMESIPPGVLKQLRESIRSGELRSADKNINYFRSARRIRRPLLFLCGKKDNMAPTEGVLAVYYQVGSKNKAIEEFGRANLYKVDYGHDDLILGKHAKKEVYPFIETWLEKN